MGLAPITLGPLNFQAPPPLLAKPAAAPSKPPGPDNQPVTPPFSPRVWEMQQQQAREAAAAAAAAQTARLLIEARKAQRALDDAVREKAKGEALESKQTDAAVKWSSVKWSASDEMRIALDDGKTVDQAAAAAMEHQPDDKNLKKVVDEAKAIVGKESPQRRQLERETFVLAMSRADMKETEGTSKAAESRDTWIAAQKDLRATLSVNLDVELKNAQTVADSDASINDPTRQLAKDDPLAHAAATLAALHPEDAEYQAQLADAVKEKRLTHTKSEVDRLMSGDEPDAAAALKVLKTNMDGATTAAERKTIFDEAGAPHFDRQFFEDKIAELTGKPPRNADLSVLYDPTMRGDKVGTWLKELMPHAPAEVADTALQVVHDKLGDSWASANDNAASMDLTQGIDLYEGLSAAVHASGKQEWADRIAAKLVDGSDEMQDLLRILMRGRPGMSELIAFDTVDTAVKGAIGDGHGAELSAAIYNRLDGRDGYDMRDRWLESMAGGVDELKKNTTDAIDNIYDPSKKDSDGGDLAMYLANFVDQKDPAAVADGVNDFRRLHPGEANQLDAASVEAGTWGMKVHEAQQALGTLKTPNAKPQTDGEKALDKAWGGLAGDEKVNTAMLQSHPLQQKLFNEAKLDIMPFPADGAEVANYGAFIARHSSNLSKLMLQSYGKHQLSVLFANPAESPKLFEKFKANYLSLAERAHVPTADVKWGFERIQTYWADAANVDGNTSLGKAEKAAAFQNLRDGLEKDIATKFGETFDGKVIRGSSPRITVGAIMDPTDARKGVGRLLTGVADIGFVTHNIATPITNLAGRGQGFNFVYQATQPIFLAKPFVNIGSVLKGANLSGLNLFKGGFGFGAFGVAVGDLVLGVQQQGQVPGWVTATNYGMAVGGAMDGIATMLSLRMRVPGWISPWGAGILAVSCIAKMSYNIYNRLQVVNRYESQNNDVLKGLLKHDGFSDKQTTALLDANKNGVNVMQAMKQMAEQHGIPFENLTSYLKKNLTDDKIGGPNDLTHQVHHLIDEHMSDDGKLPGGDPTSADAGRWVNETRVVGYGGHATTIEVPVMKKVESLDGLYTYMERTLGKFDKTPAPAPTPAASTQEPAPELMSLYMRVPEGSHLWGTSETYQNVIVPPADRDALAALTPDGRTDTALEHLLGYNPHKRGNPDFVDVGELIRIGPPLR